ncbi:MAG: hypothetical protein II969_01845 [Anaerolineaceae bacterium]|nr:hypothetical protein [Anaerolineaceae bacterium]
MLKEVIVLFLFLIVLAAAVYAGGKGLLSDDLKREDKWAAYEHRNVKKKSN